MRHFLLFSLLFTFSITLWSQNQRIDRLFRFPDIHGEKVVFTYAGDLYLSSTQGGNAKRLTSHKGFEMFAHFSPDGNTIAFTGQYDGNTEVFTIPVDGGVPKRLTHTATLGRDDVSDRMGPNNIVMGWTPDGKHIIYRSRKQTFNSFIGSLFLVPAEGGMSEEFPLSTGGFCSFSPDGDQLAFNKIFRQFRTWKYYEGGMAPDMYIYDKNSGRVEQIIKNKAQDVFPMWIGNKIYYTSDRDRVNNLFVYDKESKSSIKLTNFTDYDIKFPGFDQEQIIFEKGGFLFVFNVKNQESKRLDISIENDFIWGRSTTVDASKFITRSQLSPNGKRLLVSARGDIFDVPVEEGVTYNLTRTSHIHERDAAWSPDGKKIAWISDASGEFEIYIQTVGSDEAPKMLTKNTNNYIFSLLWSPDGSKLLWSTKKMDLNYTDVESGKTTTITKSKTWEIRDYTWSPDGKWVAFTDRDEEGLHKIFLCELSSGKITAITDGWYTATQPHFSHDGKYLIFTSSRTFNPIYSATEWNAAYRDMNRMYLIPLLKSTPSPFENQDIRDEEKNKEDKKEEAKEEDFSVDLDGIQDRQILIPTAAGTYWHIHYVNGTLYYNNHSASSNGFQLKSYNLEKEKEETLGNKMGFDLSFDRKKMVLYKGTQRFVIPLPHGKIQPEKAVNFSDLKVDINVHQEWKQIYNEAWRQMRDFFYAPNMHGVDWEAMREKYAALLPYVNHRNDLTYLIGELIGELNVGHAYINGGDRPQPKRIKTGLLGAKLSRHSSGYFKIDKILKGENYRENLRSPLSEVGLNVKEGDYITAINGVSVKQYQDVYEALKGKANTLVRLSISENPSEEGARDIIVKTIDDESKLYYYDWVQENIRKVDEATNGKVGYIHIPDMGPAGLNEFMKHFYPQLHKKALIIDDRGNGGGNVSPMIIERLRREITRANAARNQTLPGQTPRQMMVGPTILLVNQYSASDGDLFPYSFKKHQLGKVVGMRSWGGVIGIRGSLPFVDGADLRKPEFGTYAADGSSWIIEGYGVDPDVEIDNDPAREYKGIDDQLNKAIELIMKDLKDYKPVPKPPAYPDKSK